MSYAIIRNEKYTKSDLSGLYRHNERKNTSYTNKNINHNKTHLNYSLKPCNSSYIKKFDEIRETENLKGWIKKNSNIVCEYVITSDNEFFKQIGEQETKRYFKTAYEFVKNYKNLGENNIISAVVHLDEETPHMHLCFIPVVHNFDNKSQKTINKICCSEFWKGRDSYKKLQDNFYSYITKSGFNLERGNQNNNEHIEIGKLKKITNYEVQELFKDTKDIEQEVISDDIEIIREDYRRIIKKYNTSSKRYTRIKNIVDETMYKSDRIQQENFTLKHENANLKNEVINLKDYIDKTFEYMSLLFDFSKNTLKRLVNSFIDKINFRER